MLQVMQVAQHYGFWIELLRECCTNPLQTIIESTDGTSSAESSEKKPIQQDKMTQTADDLKPSDDNVEQERRATSNKKETKGKSIYI